ncbi:MAG: asparagine synthase (glutamine-hydrolyzing) [Bacteroidia bacterium]
MCGINGILNFTAGTSTPLHMTVAAMNQLIRHRGPDDQGIWEHPGGFLCLGQQRLSIIDLSAAGHQPMLSETGSAIVFNGEIYNYRELREQYVHHRFRSESDTEVLQHALDQSGIQALPHLNGMFAFAYWDERTKELLLARDCAGKKPLYYTINRGRFIFSSEIRSILSVDGVEKVPDDEQLYHFLTFNQVNAPYTLFKGIRKLKPGEWIRVSRNGQITEGDYRNIPYQDLRTIDEQEAADRILEAFRKSVRYRMIADVPVGAFLSGGVDSSAVVAAMSELTQHPVKTFTIGFEGQAAYNELSDAAKIAQQFSTDHHEKIVQQQDLIELIDKVADIFDDPVGDATAIPIYFISKLAREQGTIVVLSGDGSDELFAGYNAWTRYNKLYPAYNLFLQLPSGLRRLAASLTGSREDTRSEMLHRAAEGQEFFWGGAKAFKESYKRKLLSEAWQQRTSTYNSYDVIKGMKAEFDQYKARFPWLNHLDWMCFLGYRQQIPTRYLHRMDKLGMANSIEIRCPFLDTSFTGLALSLPPSLKIKNNIPKYILKKSFEKILDHDTLYRKKMGFCVPLKEWAGDMMSDFIDTHLNEFCKNTGYFNEAALRKQLRELQSGNKDNSNDMWTIYFLMSWFKRWM